jgi:RNA binding exosome subunit
MTTEKLNEMIAELADAFAPEVKQIEASFKTTQNHYGKYMSLISMLCKGDPVTGKVYALAMIKAGANPSGVGSALKLLFP